MPRWIPWCFDGDGHPVDWDLARGERGAQRRHFLRDLVYRIASRRVEPTRLQVWITSTLRRVPEPQSHTRKHERANLTSNILR